MEKYKEQFIEFMVRSNVLTFGDFLTKSGRRTPFFINTGNYSTGAQMASLGRFYAETLTTVFPQKIDFLFGPAYKGIPLATATATALFTSFNRNVGFCFNRKEAKDHGEGGTLVGHKPADGETVVIIEDVTTAGTSIREAIPILRSAAKVTIAGLVVSVDRMERGSSQKSALAELRDEFDFVVAAIVTLDEIVDFLYNHEIDGKVAINKKLYDRISEYRSLYGVA